jgi:hypothetical protein
MVTARNRKTSDTADSSHFSSRYIATIYNISQPALTASQYAWQCLSFVVLLLIVGETWYNQDALSVTTDVLISKTQTDFILLTQNELPGKRARPLATSSAQTIRYLFGPDIKTCTLAPLTTDVLAAASLSWVASYWWWAHSLPCLLKWSFPIIIGLI